MKTPIFRRLHLQVCFILVLQITLTGCALHKSSLREEWVTKKTLIRECDKGWIRYKVYLMPGTDTGKIAKYSRKRGEKVPLVLSIMIINTQSGTSPLRALCSNLEQYNTYYEYLLNQAKNDFVLLDGDKVEYPVYYAFENNYNAFPFETINIGYAGDSRPTAAHLKDKRLLYMDKIFSHDTLLLTLGQTLPL